MDRLDIGDGEFPNPCHQIRKECNLTESQQMMLDDAVYDLLLEDERLDKLDINDWSKGKTTNSRLGNDVKILIF